ncbi:MAG: hypothetical protein SPK88_08575 [Synergistales bacterium]|nr:hypothetical protein [Synergistales bacterium]
MTAFDEFIENRVDEILGETLKNKEVAKLRTENDLIKAELKRDLTDKQYRSICEMMDNNTGLEALQSVEYYRQGFFDGVLAMSKGF